MIRRGEKPLALIRCSFEQSQEIINKQKNQGNNTARFRLEFELRATQPCEANKLETICRWYLDIFPKFKLADFCAFEVDTYYFMN